MAVTCSTTGILTNGTCYTRQTLTPAQQKALLIYAKVIILNAYAGTDYRLTMATTLLTDASQMVCGITPDQLVAGNIALWMEAAGVTPNPLTPTLNTLTIKLDAIKCLVNADMQTLEKADLLLTCNILNKLGF